MARPASMVWTGVAVLLTASAPAAAPAAHADASPATSPRDPAIVFIQRSGDIRSLMVADPDGGHPTEVYRISPNLVFAPRIGPDRRSVVFGEVLQQQHEVSLRVLRFEVLGDGLRTTSLVTLSSSPDTSWVVPLGWSPDGERIAFSQFPDASGRANLIADLRADGTGDLRPLVQRPYPADPDEDPALYPWMLQGGFGYSPDSKAFYAWEDNAWDGTRPRGEPYRMHVLRIALDGPPPFAAREVLPAGSGLQGIYAGEAAKRHDGLLVVAAEHDGVRGLFTLQTELAQPVPVEPELAVFGSHVGDDPFTSPEAGQPTFSPDDSAILYEYWQSGFGPVSLRLYDRSRDTSTSFVNVGQKPHWSHSAPRGGSFALTEPHALVRESANEAVFVVARRGAREREAAVHLVAREIDGEADPAVAGLDFEAVDALLHWDEGDGSPQSVALPILADTLTEPPERFAVELREPTGESELAQPARTVVTIADDDGALAPCEPGPHQLCLLGRRFRAEVTWLNPWNGSSGRALAVPSTDFFGAFAFTQRDNLELIVKLLAYEDRFKLYYGQLTDLPFVLTLTDTLTGRVRVYENGPDDCGNLDDFAFPKLRRAIERAVARHAGPGRKQGPCRPDAYRLCLLEGRYAVEATWRNQFTGAQGRAGAVAISNLTGTFFFGDPRNVELMTKALDFGNGRILFLYGTLSNLEYTITLTEEASGATRTYHNPAGTFCGGLDEDAF
jgi:hypothetical protein